MARLLIYEPATATRFTFQELRIEDGDTLFMIGNAAYHISFTLHPDDLERLIETVNIYSISQQEPPK